MRPWGHSICKLDRQLGTWEDKLLGISRGRQRGRQWGISRGRQRDISLGRQRGIFQGKLDRHVLRKVSGNVVADAHAHMMGDTSEVQVQQMRPRCK